MTKFNRLRSAEKLAGGAPKKNIWRMVPRATRPKPGQGRYLQAAALGTLCAVALVFGSLPYTKPKHRALMLESELPKFRAEVSAMNLDQLIEKYNEMKADHQQMEGDAVWVSAFHFLGHRKDKLSQAKMQKDAEEELRVSVLLSNEATTYDMIEFMAKQCCPTHEGGTLKVSRSQLKSKLFQSGDITDNELFQKYIESKERTGRRNVDKKKFANVENRDSIKSSANEGLKRSWSMALSFYRSAEYAKPNGFAIVKPPTLQTRHGSQAVPFEANLLSKCMSGIYLMKKGPKTKWLYVQKRFNSSHKLPKHELTYTRGITGNVTTRIAKIQLSIPTSKNANVSLAPVLEQIAGEEFRKKLAHEREEQFVACNAIVQTKRNPIWIAENADGTHTEVNKFEQYDVRYYEFAK